MDNDPYDHLRSIHNCHDFYDHSKNWITHCSIQKQSYKTTEFTDEWRDNYRKPVIVDECAYEGNINHGWGNITAFEMVRRFWEGYLRGGYVTHGETYLNDEEILWWSKGSVLIGDSPKRISFLKNILDEGPDSGITPIEYSWDLVCGGIKDKYYLFYFGYNQPKFRTFNLPEDKNFSVDIIDTWGMTIKKMNGSFKGQFKLDLPGIPYIAVRMHLME